MLSLWDQLNLALTDYQLWNRFSRKQQPHQRTWMETWLWPLGRHGLYHLFSGQPVMLLATNTRTQIMS